MFDRFVPRALVASLCAALIAGCPGEADHKHETLTVQLDRYNNSGTRTLSEDTVIDHPTRFAFSVTTNDVLSLEETVSETDDLRVWVVLADPFGANSAQYLPIKLSYAGTNTYSGSLSRTVPEFVGIGGQLQPARWRIRADKLSSLVALEATVTCEVTYVPYGS
jgi:hypothetical protein